MTATIWSPGQCIGHMASIYTGTKIHGCDKDLARQTGQLKVSIVNIRLHIGRALDLEFTQRIDWTGLYSTQVLAYVFPPIDAVASNEMTERGMVHTFGRERPLYYFKD